MNWDNVYTYDTETYPNFFSFGCEHVPTGRYWYFEISDRRNDSTALISFILQLRDAKCRMLGLNNEHFDYPIIHFIVSLGYATAAQIYQKSQQIFATERNDWSNVIWERDRYVPQIDVFKIMHFDNVSKSTSLKKLQGAMKSITVVDLPYAPGTVLTGEQMDVTAEYMRHDITETTAFARLIEDQIAFRDTLSARYDKDFTNYNDTKIGKQVFIDRLEASGIACYEHVNGKRQMRQTPRYEGIHVKEKLLPLPFQTPDLQRMWTFFNNAVIPAHMTKGFFTDLSARLGPFQLDFGAGGLHGSVSRHTFRANDTHTIIDVDVESYYPSLAIVNRWFPHHLGEMFCDIYADLKRERVSYKKGTAENAMLKLALNGVYGDSNNVYSPFLDPAYTMAITINGQLQLAWLAEMMVLNVPGVELIQVNTDGLTLYVPREHVVIVEDIKRHWMEQTRLKLEQVEYKNMYIRDVNSYIAHTVADKYKYVGAYSPEVEWHQDHSSLVIPKAVAQFVKDGTRPVDFIYGHTDAFDFMRHIKVNRNSRLEWGGKVIQNTSRYFIANDGKPLIKIMPPLAGKQGERQIGVDVGWQTVPCNSAYDFNWHNLNRTFYVAEAEKLVASLGVTCY